MMKNTHLLWTKTERHTERETEEKERNLGPVPLPPKKNFGTVGLEQKLSVYNSLDGVLGRCGVPTGLWIVFSYFRIDCK